MKPKPTAGQRLFSLNVGNRARNSVQNLEPVIVTRVGRKYFTVATDDQWRFEVEFHLDTWRERTDYSTSHCLYETEQQWRDETERHAIIERCRKAFDIGSNKDALTDLEMAKIAKTALGTEVEG